MYKSFVRWGAASAVAAAGWALACSFAQVPAWLENGGIAAVSTPEFYWEEEVRKLAEPFKPAEKRVVSIGTTEPQSAAEQLSAAHQTDEGEATAKHGAKGAEFEEYEKGAEAFRAGESQWDQAKATWEALLQRPANERHYRSVWAAFMLGKLALRRQQPEAVKWFQMTRQLAKDGFADTLGLAADSYGWEAKSELERGQPEKAAPLYLSQLALGDESAVVSLKNLVGDQWPLEHHGGFPPVPPEGADAATLAKLAAETRVRENANLERAARDPLLRRITSAHILAIEGGVNSWYDGERGQDWESRSQRWLKAVEKAQLSKIDDAAELGWIAYTAGRYAEAERWLKMSPGVSPEAKWLQAKLLRRAGKLKEATQLMAEVVRRIPPPTASQEENRTDFRFVSYGEGLPDPVYSASGDLGALHLARGQFISAFEAFQKGGLDRDADFVAEHVLTADELRKYIDSHGSDSSGFQENARWVLARHLIRDRRYNEARPYLPEYLQPVLDEYTTALNRGADAKLSKIERARAYFDAAVIIRYHGDELVATADAPYRLNAGNAFPRSTVATERETGKMIDLDYSGTQVMKKIQPVRLHVAVTAEERKRLAASQMAPGKPHHFLYTAAAHGWKAAALLPDQSAELADVLNTCGRWIQNDARAADKFFQAIEVRASKTEIGKAAGLKHWFVLETGPWSGSQKEQ